MYNFLVFISILSYLSASELSWRPKHTFTATRKPKLENVTFLSYSFHFVLQKHNYMMLEFTLEKGKKAKIKKDLS